MKVATPWQGQGNKHTGPTLYQEVRAARPPPIKPLCSAGRMAAGYPLPKLTLALAFLWSPSPSSPGLTLPLLWSLL